jgi:hypothetical protein
MSTDVREHLRHAAGDPLRGPDVAAAMRRGDRLRTRRRGAGVAAALSVAAVAVVALTGLPATTTPPEIGSPPAETEDGNWSELTRGRLSDGATWVLDGQTTHDAVCVRWHIPGTDREQTNCVIEVDWDDMETNGADMLVLRNLDPEVVVGYAGPAITTVEVGLADGSTVDASLLEIQRSGFHAYMVETRGQAVNYVTGRDADGQVRTTTALVAPH